MKILLIMEGCQAENVDDYQCKKILDFSKVIFFSTLKVI